MQYDKSIVKTLIKIFLICIILVTSYLFKKIYFSDKNINQNSFIESDPADNLTNKSNQNNSIKNLKYEFKFDLNTRYIITSKLSNIEYKNNNELIKMQTVSAKILDQENISLIINSKNADFDKLNYNTLFYKNVETEYLNNKIISDNLYLDVENNFINIYGNVLYNGEYGKINTDNIKVDLLKKKN